MTKYGVKMLRLSPKFFNEIDYLSKGYVVAFNPKENKIFFCKPEKAQGKITNLGEIAKQINHLQKPIFDDIEQYRTCHQKIKKINEKINAHNGRLTKAKAQSAWKSIDLSSFNTNLQPTAKSLKEKVWAVHATKVFPSNGVLTPFIDRVGKDVALSSIQGISNTIHFALGELVRPHSKVQSWEDRPFAVITPLGTILDKTVNIFAHDTFVNGQWLLKKETVVLVPEGTKNTLPKDIECQVVTYKQDAGDKNSLRLAIDKVIKQQGGLTFRMANDSANLGSKATLDDDININTVDFFKNILEENPGKISFGDHCDSQVGKASQLGMIRELSVNLSKYSHIDLFNPINIANKYLSYCLLSYLYERAKNEYFDQEQQKAVEEFLLRKKGDLPDYESCYPFIWMSFSPNYLNSLNWAELVDFKATHAELFKACHEHEFEATWAACRWLVIGHKKGLEEGLDRIINNEFKKFEKTKAKSFSLEFIGILNRYYQNESDRQDLVKHILKLDGVQAYLRMLKPYEYQFKARGYDLLDAVT